VEYNFPTIPKTKKELFHRVKNLIGTNEWLPIPSECGKGSGAPGDLLERLLGSEGDNKAIADSVGVEIKYHSTVSKCLLTLFHNDPDGGSVSIFQMVQTYGRLSKKGVQSFRHAISDTSQLRVIRLADQITVRPKKGRGFEVSWDGNRLVGAAGSKLRHVILIHGRTKTINGIRHAQYNTAQSLTDFRVLNFLNAVMGKYILIEFDAREKEPWPGGKKKKNHGTKFRMNLKDLGEIWETIQEIESVDR